MRMLETEENLNTKQQLLPANTCSETCAPNTHRKTSCVTIRTMQNSEPPFHPSTSIGDAHTKPTQRQRSANTAPTQRTRNANATHMTRTRKTLQTTCSTHDRPTHNGQHLFGEVILPNSPDEMTETGLIADPELVLLLLLHARAFADLFYIPRRAASSLLGAEDAAHSA